MSFIQAKWRHTGRRGLNGDGKIHGVVVHSMEAPEKGTTAESVARYFANGSGGKPSSADICFDSNSQVECVKPQDEAYHAPPASRWTRGYEHAGYARQTAADWHDPYSWAMLQRSGTTLGNESRLYKFPLVYLNVAALKDGHFDGVTTHNDVSKAFKQSSHWDPGPGFPMNAWLDMAKRGAHLVVPPPAYNVYKLGSHGPGVAFLQDMLNLVALYRGHDGKPGPILIIDKNRNNAGFGPKTKDAVIAFQKFLLSMWNMSGQKGAKPMVDGVVGKQTAAGLAYWTSAILKKR